MKKGILVLLFAVLLASSVVAAPFVSRVGSGISGYFDRYASNPAPNFLDLLIFSVILIAVCWIGFSKAFPDAKGAGTALAITLGIAFSIALVYGGKFTVKKLLPVVGLLLALLAVVGIFYLLQKIFNAQTTGGKILGGVVAVVISIIIILIVLEFVCGSGKCDNNSFLKKVVGSESLIAKMFGWLGEGSVSSSSPTPNTPKTTPQPQTTSANATVAGTATGTTSKSSGVNYPLMIGIAVGAIALIGGYTVYHKRQKRKQLEKHENAFAEAVKDRKRIAECFKRIVASFTEESAALSKIKMSLAGLTAKENLKETISDQIQYCREIDTAYKLTDDCKKVESINRDTVKIIQGKDGVMDTIRLQISEISRMKSAKGEDIKKEEISKLERIMRIMNEFSLACSGLEEDCRRVHQVIGKLSDGKGLTYQGLIAEISLLRDLLNSIAAKSEKKLLLFNNLKEDLRIELDILKKLETEQIDEITAAIHEMQNGSGASIDRVNVIIAALQTAHHLKPYIISPEISAKMDLAMRDGKNALASLVPKIHTEFVAEIKAKPTAENIAIMQDKAVHCFLNTELPDEEIAGIIESNNSKMGRAIAILKGVDPKTPENIPQAIAELEKDG